MDQMPEGKRALATGGSRGIRAAIVKRLAKKGVDSTSTGPTKPIAALKTLGVRALAIQTDAGNAKAILAQAVYRGARVADFARKPAGIDPVQAAATPISALTAWRGLIEVAEVPGRPETLRKARTHGLRRTPCSHPSHVLYCRTDQKGNGRPSP